MNLPRWGALLLLCATVVSCQTPKQAQPAATESATSPTATASSPTPTATASSPTPTATAVAASTAPPSPSPAAGPPHLVVVGSSGARFTRGGAPGQGPVHHVAPGVVLPLDGIQAGWAHVQTPCEQSGWVRLADAKTISHATVVLDPGHGGAGEPGAVGSGGLVEKDVNLDVTNRTAGLLRAQGIDVVLTRTSDYMATIAFRVTVAASVQPAAFVSIHHNAAPDGPSPGPGTETFYQYTSATSKRLAGLLYEEVTKALGAFHATWVGNTDRGARWRLNDEGGDYYGILRHADDDHLMAGIAEMAFISNPSEEALLRRADVREAEAQAIARALVRFLTTKDPGSGFSIPHPRREPAGGGGGGTGCVDPIGP